MAESNAKLKDENTLQRGSLNPQARSSRKVVSLVTPPPATPRSRRRSLLSRDPRVNINISGKKFQLMKKTFIKYPTFRITRILAELKGQNNADNFASTKSALAIEPPDNEGELYDYYDTENKEFYFEREPGAFPSLVSFLTTGHLHIPRTMCLELFQEECTYWGVQFLPYDCCQGYHQQQFESIDVGRKANMMFQNRAKLASRTDLADIDEDIVADSIVGTESVLKTIQSKIRVPTCSMRWKRFQRRAWDFFEEPRSSTAAKILNLFSTLMVLMSTIVLCLNSHPEIAVIATDGSKLDNPHMYVVEIICIIWFTFEFSARVVVAPQKHLFVKSIMNWIDFLAILPFYVELVVEIGGKADISSTFTNARKFMQTLRILRVIRIFKVARHSAGLQVLGYTIRNSGPEFGLLGMLLLMGMTLFSTLVYYAEEGSPNTKFESIIASFWWAIITMTTVGYGDLTPTSTGGQFVGAICCISGILFIALPIPTIVTNFSSYYKDHRNKKKLEELYDSDFEMPHASFSGDLSFASFEDGHNGAGESLRRATSYWKKYKKRSSDEHDPNSLVVSTMALKKAAMIRRGSHPPTSPSVMLGPPTSSGRRNSLFPPDSPGKRSSILPSDPIAE